MAHTPSPTVICLFRIVSAELKRYRDAYSLGMGECIDSCVQLSKLRNAVQDMSLSNPLDFEYANESLDMLHEFVFIISLSQNESPGFICETELPVFEIIRSLAKMLRDKLVAFDQSNLDKTLF